MLATKNAFIFNFIENNDADVELLEQSLTRVNCRVATHKHLGYDKLRTEVDKIIAGDSYSLFEYIVVVILDNTNPCDYRLTPQSSDGFHFMWNRDLLDRFGENKELGRMPRLVVIQANRNNHLDKAYLGRGGATTTYSYVDNQIYSMGIRCSLPDLWPTSDSPPSRFIKTFCEYFAAEGSKTFGELGDRIILQMRTIKDDARCPKCCYAKEQHFYPQTLNDDRSQEYGLAMSDTTKNDFFHSLTKSDTLSRE